jgi:hypothetical protein
MSKPLSRKSGQGILRPDRDLAFLSIADFQLPIVDLGAA